MILRKKFMWKIRQRKTQFIIISNHFGIYYLFEYIQIRVIENMKIFR